MSLLSRLVVIRNNCIQNKKSCFIQNRFLVNNKPILNGHKVISNRFIHKTPSVIKTKLFFGRETSIRRENRFKTALNPSITQRLFSSKPEQKPEQKKTLQELINSFDCEEDIKFQAIATAVGLGILACIFDNGRVILGILICGSLIISFCIGCLNPILGFAILCLLIKTTNWLDNLCPRPPLDIEF